MRGFQNLLSKSKVWLTLGAGVGVTAYTLNRSRINAWCESEYVFDPNVPVNLPTGYPKWDYDWDKRQPYTLAGRMQGKGETEEKYHELLEKNKSKAVRNIYLIRVGEYDENKSACESGLTQVGREQVALTAKRLNEMAAQRNVKFNSISSAAVPVAKETAEILQKNLGVKCTDSDPLLQEGCPSYPEPITHSISVEPKQLFQDGSRIEAGFRKYFHRADPTQEEDSFEVIVCDANVIRYFICRAMQFPSQAWLRMMLAHGSINVISINPRGGVVLRAVGESGFLPPNKLTA
ncbi:unnamed protein product [Allacma fusca]|uniref:Serine/threonine-protein phosphatase PGAM5, mitochondrial n=1 Tax=Allacma fusca TaxID=39272 RepID=A0A8J2PI72_9HEXA|nr:unnamed protein product [Allacma fusca]